MNLKIIKKLAKSDNYQILYNRMKEINGINLFKNTYDFSKIQILFLYFLQLYNILYQDLRDKKKFLTEDVINDDLRCEAYLLIRDKENIKDEKNSKREVTTSSTIPSVLFKKKK